VLSTQFSQRYSTCPLPRVLAISSISAKKGFPATSRMALTLRPISEAEEPPLVSIVPSLAST
jgi:hypothetical protein